MRDNGSLNWVFGGRGEENEQFKSYIQELKWTGRGAGLAVWNEGDSSQEQVLNFLSCRTAWKVELFIETGSLRNELEINQGFFRGWEWW